MPESTTTLTTPPSTISSTTEPSIWPPPQELLDEAVLEISDMPTGWAFAPDDGDGFDLSFSELSYPPLGDQSYAWRLTVTDGDITFTSDAVDVRVGDVVIQVAGYDVFGDPTDIIDQFAELQLARAVEVLG